MTQQTNMTTRDRVLAILDLSDGLDTESRRWVSKLISDEPTPATTPERAPEGPFSRVRLSPAKSSAVDDVPARRLGGRTGRQRDPQSLMGRVYAVVAKSSGLRAAEVNAAMPSENTSSISARLSMLKKAGRITNRDGVYTAIPGR